MPRCFNLLFNLFPVFSVKIHLFQVLMFSNLLSSDMILIVSIVFDGYPFVGAEVHTTGDRGDIQTAAEQVDQHAGGD